MKTLTKKTNRTNVVDSLNKIMGKIMITGVQITEKTIKFYANEKNGDLSPLAKDIFSFSKKNGFEMTARPIGKSTTHNEYYKGKYQKVKWQWTLYTLK